MLEGWRVGMLESWRVGIQESYTEAITLSVKSDISKYHCLSLSHSAQSTAPVANPSRVRAV